MSLQSPISFCDTEAATFLGAVLVDFSTCPPAWMTETGYYHIYFATHKGSMAKQGGMAKFGFLRRARIMYNFFCATPSRTVWS